MQKFIISFLAGVLLTPCLTPIYAKQEENIDQAVILHTNDVHSNIESYAAFAAYREFLLEEGYDVITVDAVMQSRDRHRNATEGTAPADLMNSVPYDFAVPGNHEFDYGMDAFLSIAQNEDTAYQYICSNFINLETDEPVFAPYAIHTLKGDSMRKKVSFCK